MGAYGVDEGLSQLFVGAVVLEVWVGEAVQASAVVHLLGHFVLGYHVEGQEVHDRLLPGVGFQRVDLLYAVQVVVLHLLQGAFVGGPALSRDVFRWVDL